MSPHEQAQLERLLDREQAGDFHPATYVQLERDAWRALGTTLVNPLGPSELEGLRALGDRIDFDEVAAIYLPLSRLLNFYVAATQKLWQTQQLFLGNDARKVPFIIAIAGSVAVGKSTTARILQALLSRWPDHPTVDLITTDGFLLPNRVLQERGLMERKGFPESYDRRALVRFLADLKSGVAEVPAPVYSHLVYDVVPGATQVIRQPDILILEGLNVLQTGALDAARSATVFLSDFFDFSIYVDAAEGDIRRWYVERFLALRETAFTNEQSYFRRYASTPVEECVRFAQEIWQRINGPNLAQNIAPTRSRARLVLAKGGDHTVQRILLRKL